MGDALTLYATVIVPVQSIKMVPSFAGNPMMPPKSASVGTNGGSTSLFLPQPVVLALLVTAEVIMHQRVTLLYMIKPYSRNLLKNLAQITAPCVCGEQYDAHMPLVSGPSESDANITSRPLELAPSAPSAINHASNFNATAAVVARNPPGLAYATTRPSGLFSAFNHPDPARIQDPNARSIAAAIPQNSSDTLPTPAANRDRMVAAARHRNSNSSVPLSVSAASSLTSEFNFAFWPFVVRADYYAKLNDTYVVSKVHTNLFHRKKPLQPNFSARVLGEVVDCLSENNLVFTVKIPQTEIDHPWQIIDRTLYEHLATHGIELPRRPRDVGEEFRHMAWDVMGPVLKKSKKTKNVNVTFLMGTAGSVSFNTDFLRQQVLDVELESQTTTVPFILIGPSLSIDRPSII